MASMNCNQSSHDYRGVGRRGEVVSNAGGTEVNPNP